MAVQSQIPRSGIPARGKDLAIVIVSWNVREALLANLRALFQSRGDFTFDVIVVDNASIDGTVDAVKREHPDVAVIHNVENAGFARACNQGIKRAQARHILLLNPDMRIEPDALAKTAAYLDEHPDMAVVGAKLIGSDGKPMHHMRRFPRLSDQIIIALKLKKLFPGIIRRYMGEDLDPEVEQDVDTVRGSYFAINRSALERIGGLDERYFVWFEEVDYCRQAKEMGMRVRYVPSIVAHDLVGKSFGQRRILWKQTQFRRSMLRYFRKWHSAISFLLLWLAWFLVWPVVLYASFPRRRESRKVDLDPRLRGGDKL